MSATPRATVGFVAGAGVLAIVGFALAIQAGPPATTLGTFVLTVVLAAPAAILALAVRSRQPTNVVGTLLAVFAAGLVAMGVSQLLFRALAGIDPLPPVGAWAVAATREGATWGAVVFGLLFHLFPDGQVPS